jgi:hypothetical protein
MPVEVGRILRSPVQFRGEGVGRVFALVRLLHPPVNIIGGATAGICSLEHTFLSSLRILGRVLR